MAEIKKHYRIKNRDEQVVKAVSFILLAVFSISCICGFLLVLGSSFQSEKEIQEYGYSILPRKFSLEAYRAVFSSPDMILRSYFVTFLTTVIGTAVGVCISASAG